MISDKPLISIVLGIYNAERTLDECLSSIFNQNFPLEKYEVIIVDGGSKDNTMDIVSKYKNTWPNVKVLHNPNQLSEGLGNGKDQGVNASEGDIIIFIDHDNIMLTNDWLERIIEPFKDEDIFASQSFLKYKSNDSFFLKYINAVGVEDPFAIPHSIVAQAVLNPQKFEKVNNYFFHVLNPDWVLFGGANGCAFRKSVFEKIGGYTRDVDVFASMADYKMKVALPIGAYIYHKTANNIFSFLKKKGIYFYRFIQNDYSWKKFSWSGKDFKGNLFFFIRVLYNLSLIGPCFLAIKQIIKTKELFWLIHPPFLFLITVEYGLITLIKFQNFARYTFSKR